MTPSTPQAQSATPTTPPTPEEIRAAGKRGDFDALRADIDRSAYSLRRSLIELQAKLPPVKTVRLLGRIASVTAALATVALTLLAVQRRFRRRQQERDVKKALKALRADK